MKNKENWPIRIQMTDISKFLIQGGILSDRKCEFIEIFLEKILDLKLLWNVEVDGSCSIFISEVWSSF